MANAFLIPSQTTSESAYQSAIRGGYVGSQEEFNMMLANIRVWKTINLYITTPAGFPVEGASISGITDAFGKTLVTDSNGFVKGVVETDVDSVSVTVTANKTYLDMNSTVSQTIALTELNTTATIAFTRKSATSASYETSTTIYFSPDVSELDVSCAGGGGGGGGFAAYQDDEGDIQKKATGGGGGGGYVTNDTVMLDSDKDIKIDIIVGAGGSGGGNGYTSSSTGSATGRVGSDGGETSLSVDGVKKVSAAGGKGGSFGQITNGTCSRGTGGEGNGSGGGSDYTGWSGASSGGNATQSMLYPAEKTVGGGGAGGVSYNYTSGQRKGGTPYGGSQSTDSIKGGKNATGTSGGGAGGTDSYYLKDGYVYVGAGYKGAVGIAWRYRA